VQWVRELRKALSVTKPVSLVGYSYGSFIAATIAQLDSDAVDKLVLIAPASVLAPVEFGWLWRAIVYGVVWQGPWFTKYMAADPNFVFEKDVGTARHLELMEATNALSTTVLAVNPDVFSDADLATIASKHRTLLVIGDHETVTNHEVAVAAARKAGFTVDLIPKSGTQVRTFATVFVYCNCFQL
jgi:pimeloyl-ACP methyl ester carboxylesterase